jgi:hypothetical protein
LMDLREVFLECSEDFMQVSHDSLLLTQLPRFFDHNRLLMRTSGSR